MLTLPQVEIIHKGFDIQQWSPVQHIDAFYVKDILPAGDKADNRKTNRVRTARMTRGKKPVQSIIQERFDLQPVTVRFVENIQQDEI